MQRKRQVTEPYEISVEPIRGTAFIVGETPDLHSAKLDAVLAYHRFGARTVAVVRGRRIVDCYDGTSWTSDYCFGQDD